MSRAEQRVGRAGVDGRARAPALGLARRGLIGPASPAACVHKRHHVTQRAPEGRGVAMP